MKALELHAIGDLRLVDIERPAPSPEGLLVKTGAALICTSDINDLRRNVFHLSLPVVMGHEGAGTVVGVGRKVKGFKTGDRVAAHPVHPCGKCANCREGMGHLCSDMKHFGINMQGTFAEYFVVRQDRARKIGKSVPFEVAALAEPVSVCLEALAQARLRQGDRLLIVGDGPFGVLIARLAGRYYTARRYHTAGRHHAAVRYHTMGRYHTAVRMGLSKVVVAGHHDFRLSKIGRATGINTHTVSDVAAALMKETGGRGYDAMILAVGSAKAFETGLDALKAKGRAVVFSAILDKAPVDLFRVHVKELEIVGACNDNDMLDRAVRVLADKRLALAELVTHRLALADFEKAFALAEAGREEAMKVAFTFEPEGKK